MAVDPRARNVLDRQEIQVIRAKYDKEIKVTVDPKAEIAFGNDKVALGEVEEWLSQKARRNSRWTTITNIAAVATVMIAVLAFFVGAWQAYISNDTEKRTLRAYVGVVDHHVENVALNGTAHVQVMMKNFGSTPASKLTYWIASKFDRHPNPLDLPVQAFKPDSIVLFPTDGFTATFDIGSLNEVDMAGLNDGSRLLYVYGEIDYLDTFTTRRCTRFRLMYGGQQLLKIGRMALAEKGNEIDERCQP